MSTTGFPLPSNYTTTEEGLLLSATTTLNETAKEYDHNGAALYIAVILIWYSTGLAMMLFLQVRPRSLPHQFLFDSSNSSTKKSLQTLSTNPFTGYRNIQADNTTKQILNELKDPVTRTRLWNIYYASTEKNNEPHPKYNQTITADKTTIDRINRKLADIHRLDTVNDESPITTNPVSLNNNRSSISVDSAKNFAKRLNSLRRPNGGGGTTPNTRPPLMRIHSQDETSSPNTTVEMESFITGKPSTRNTSRKPSLFSSRFTIEKVSDSKTIPDLTNENKRE
ncbi:unnamed protein product [Adineta steineri]|uniref:Uncharacterized protein n=1 Tax=Adineta steineri TaxID=433720 RepID=A0A814EES5_9BILA|nr:unnamed protein product [Adineta steineri]